MERWTRAMIRYRWAVVAVWAVVFVMSSAAASGLSGLLTNRFTLPGTDTQRAEKILEDRFGQRTTGSFMLVVRTAPGSANQLVPAVDQAAHRAAGVLPSGVVASVQPVSDSVVSARIVSNLEPADAKGYTGTMRAAAGTVPGARLYVTGQAAIEHDLDPVFKRDLQIGELYIAIPIALVILAFVFGTLAFLLPLIFAAAAIPATLAIIWIFAHYMELSTYLQNLITLIGLGIAVDYSLLIIYRYREELRRGRERPDAIVATMRTAGRAVVFSGTAVAIGLALMLAMPVPFMRGFGIGGLFIPVVSVICALTLLPVLLYFLAAKLDRVRLLPRSITERREAEENFWARFARAIMRHPVAIAAGTTALLITLALPVTALELGPGSNKGIPRSLESVQGLDILSGAVGGGALAPTAVVIDTHQPGGADDPQLRAALSRFQDGLHADPEVAAVVFDPSAASSAASSGGQFVDPSRRYLQLQVIGKSEYGVPASLDFADRLRHDIVTAAGFPTGVSVYAGGGPPSGVDFLDLTYRAFPWLVLGVLVLTYFLLLRAFRSIVLPLKAIILNLLSITAAYGLLVVFFKWGAGSALGLISFDQIEGWIPVFIFAMVFGLSMDYEVFLVSRMREEWDAGHDNETAVVLGLARTGRIVTAAGLVMFAAFMGFVAGSIVGLQQFGFGLAAAIILDVTIIRALLVPSAMKLFGRWNWWLPRNVARVFRVRNSPLAPRAHPAADPGGLHG
ncbi:MMPL family transporter [Frankia sp. CiP3]|uniref:MMPL family transporter n=1 Tax=Frankia sp. CiP3 TaxID=2880971 RepID=UPI001EF4EDCA|nr:MMPL family transporter [Frankia sp. CiP3]